jgi:phosphopantothenoylcysteine decarboxylase/phosphopantothenate--cysteine ligase
MHREVVRLLPETDILIMSAAVADYEVVTPAGGKIGKSQGEVRVSLAPTTDILCEVALAKRPDQFVVGFAAEYGMEGLLRAREKLVRKRLDMIVFNDISRSDIGFNSDYNEVHILTPDGETKVERAPKETIAEIVLDHIARAVRARTVATTVGR